MHIRCPNLIAGFVLAVATSVLVLASTCASACERGDTPRPQSDDLCGQES